MGIFPEKAHNCWFYWFLTLGTCKSHHLCSRFFCQSNIFSFKIHQCNTIGQVQLSWQFTTPSHLMISPIWSSVQKSWELCQVYSYQLSMIITIMLDFQYPISVTLSESSMLFGSFAAKLSIDIACPKRLITMVIIVYFHCSNMTKSLALTSPISHAITISNLLSVLALICHMIPLPFPFILFYLSLSCYSVFSLTNIF